MKNNMQKSFEKKSALRAIRMADGGLVDKAKTDLAARPNRIDEAEKAAVSAPAPAPAPAKPAPAPAPAPSTDASRAAVGMPPKKGMLRTLLGLAEGGHVTGPGGPREDKIPAMLSDGEYVLPAKTVEKLGGPEEIDEIVRATNDGREPEGAEERAEGRHSLRKLASGGFVGPLDPNDPRYAAAQNRAFNPTNAGMQSSIRMEQGLQGPARPAGVAPQPTAAPTPVAAPAQPAQTSLRQLKTRAGGLAGLAAPAAISGAYDSIQDTQNGYRDEFNARTGTNGVVGDTLRTLSNVGNAITFNQAGKIGQGISSMLGGGSFSEGYGADTARDQFLNRAAPSAQPTNLGEVGPPSSLARPPTTAVPTDAAPSPRSSAQSRFLSEQGVDAATQASAPVRGDLRGMRTEPGKFVNLGSFLGPDNIYGTSSKPGGRINSFVGAGDPNRQESPQTIAAVEKLQSDLAADRLKTQQKEQADQLARASAGNAGAINARFDAMAKSVAGSYSAQGKGNEKKRLLEIEAQRNNALEADARNATSVRGQTLQAQNQFNENATKNRELDLVDRQRRDTLRGQLTPKPLEIAKFDADRADQARKNEEEGQKAVDTAISASIARRFPNTKDDKAQAAQAEQLAAFMRSAPPEVLSRIRSQNPTERDAGIQLAINLFDQTQAVNAYQGDTFRGIGKAGVTLPKGDARRVQLGDFAGPGSLPLTAAPRYVAGVFGADAGKVQPMETGAVVPLDTLTQDEYGNKSASKLTLLQQQRELQRKNEEAARMERLKKAATQ